MLGNAGRYCLRKAANFFVHELVFGAYLAQGGVALDLDGLLLHGLGIVVEKTLVVFIPNIVGDSSG